MVGYVDFGLDVQAAIEMPRARLWDGKQIFLERRVRIPSVSSFQPAAMMLFCYPNIHGALAVCRRCHVTLTAVHWPARRTAGATVRRYQLRTVGYE